MFDVDVMFDLDVDVIEFVVEFVLNIVKLFLNFFDCFNCLRL